MELQSLKKLKTRTGTPKVLQSFFQQELIKDLAKLASEELNRRVLTPIVGTCPSIKPSKYGVEIEVEVVNVSDALTIVNRTKTITTFNVDHYVKTTGASSLLVIEVNQKLIARQLSELSTEKKSIALDVLNESAISISIHVKGRKKEDLSKKPIKKKASNKPTITTPKKSILTASALTISDLGLRLKTKYNIRMLDSIIDKAIKKYVPAVPLLSAILKHARELNDKPERIKSALVVHDLNTIEKNFLVAVAAVSALHANPKALLMFVTKTSFVLLEKKRPLARFGKKLDAKMPMKKRFEECRKECGSFPGSTKAIMDVLDAEGKKNNAAVKELFNDLSKHVITNSGGVAAKAAVKFKKAAVIESRINWQSFNTAFSEAAKHVKEIKYSPMVERMEAAVKELHRNRNVLKLGQMKWQEIFEKKKLDWLGALSADILEDEVNMKKEAKEALSCVANWMENVVECSLKVHHLGTVGDEFILSPCKKFKFKTWQIELQDIMKSGPKWK